MCRNIQCVTSTSHWVNILLSPWPGPLLTKSTIWWVPVHPSTQPMPMRNTTATTEYEKWIFGVWMYMLDEQDHKRTHILAVTTQLFNSVDVVPLPHPQGHGKDFNKSFHTGGIMCTWTFPCVVKREREKTKTLKSSNMRMLKGTCSDQNEMQGVTDML